MKICLCVLSGTFSIYGLFVIGPDGTTTASISAAQFDSSAIFAKDVGNVSLTDSGMFASANAGTGINVSAIYALTGPDAGNYSLVIPRNGKTKGVTLTADITPAQLTVQNEVAANKNYDGTTAAALSNGTLVGVVSGESVGLSEAGNFISAGPGNGIGVVTNDSLTGTASVLANYTLTQPSTLANPTIFANITQSSNVLTVIGTKVSTKTYNGTTTATVTGGTLSCAPNCNGVTLSQSGHFNSADAGSAVGVTVTDKITGTNAKNYTLQEPTNVTGTINPKTVTVSGVKGTGFVYDTSTTDPLTGTPVLSGLVTGQALTVSNYSVGTLASPNYGTEAVTTNMMLNSTATGNASDYVLTQPKLSVTISKDPIVATSTTDNKTYDGTTAGTATPLLYSGTLYNGDTLTGGKYTFNSANAGTRTLLISGVTTTADSEDYSITYHNTTNDVISPIQLYYTATPTPIPVGGTVPTLSGTITGTFASGQTLANQSTGTAVWKLTTALPKGNPQGYYGITGSGIKLDNGNYKLSQSASNATSLCIGEQSCPQPPLQMLKVNLTQQKPIAGAANPLPQIETVLESVPLPQDSVKTRLPGLHIRGVGVKLPGDTVAMN